MRIQSAIVRSLIERANSFVPAIHSRHWLTTRLLLVFVTVLAQSFFALVRCHLVAFAFLSVRHISKMLIVNYVMLIHEHLGGLESRDVVLGDDDDSVLADIAGGLLRAGLHDEAAKTTQANILAISERILNGVHEFFNSFQNRCFVNACRLSNFSNDFCFSHCIL